MVVGVVVTFGAGVAIGRLSAPVQPAVRSSATTRQTAVTHGPSAHACATDSHGTPAAPLAERDDAQLFAALRAGPTPRDAVAISEALAQRLEKDHASLAAFLDRFSRERDPGTLWALAQVLALVDHPSVRSIAGTIATDTSRSRESRAAALRVLEGHNLPDVLPAVRTVLATEPDPELQLRAIHALPDARGMTWSDAAGVTAALIARSGAGEPDVRRAAMLALGDWCHDEGSRLVLVRSIRADPSPAVRAAAAFGLIFASKDSATLQALASAVQARDEDWTVRENAWRALGAERVLPDDLARVYADFSAERTRLRRTP